MRNVRTEAQAELLSLYRQLHKLDDMRAEVLREIKTSERTPPSSVHPDAHADECVISGELELLMREWLKKQKAI